MNASEFGFIQGLVRRGSGIEIEPGKEYLAESRLAPLANREGFGSIGEMISALRSGGPEELSSKVVEAMATRETTFFRDPRAFEALRTRVLPEIVSRRRSERSLAIWCAACSSGQEPYSVAMILRDRFPELAGWTVRLVASDMSAEALHRARTGLFSHLEINRGLPATMLVRHFVKRGLEWQIDDRLRRAVEFRRINLASEWPALPAMDLILLRNILIYFDLETKRTVLAGMRRLLRPGGLLFLGSTETTMNVDDAFEPVDMDGAVFHRLGT